MRGGNMSARLIPIRIYQILEEHSDQEHPLSMGELLAIFPNRKLRSYEEVIHRLVCLSEEEVLAPAFAKKKDISNALRGQQYER